MKHSSYFAVVEKFYKNSLYQIDYEFSILEFDFFKNSINSCEDFILKTALLNEITGFEKPKYIIINKKGNGFVIDGRLIEFTNHVLLDRIVVEFGIKNIFILVDKNEFNICRNINHVLFFNQLDDILNYIRNMENNLKCNSAGSF